MGLLSDLPEGFGDHLYPVRRCFRCGELFEGEGVYWSGFADSEDHYLVFDPVCAIEFLVAFGSDVAALKRRRGYRPTVEEPQVKWDGIREQIEADSDP